MPSMPAAQPLQQVAPVPGDAAAMGTGGGGDEQGWGEEGRVMEGTGDGWGRGTDGDKAGMGVSR